MVKEIGRLSGKFTKRRLTDTEHAHLQTYLQTYLLTTCEDVLQYESLYMAELRMTHRHATEDELRQLRDNRFAAWLRSYVEVALGDRKENVKLEGVEAKADDVSKGAVKLSDDKQDTAVGNDYNKDLKIVSLVPKCIREVEDEDEDDEDDEC
ncbi:hypothetical protein F2Q70_00013150 [Brassica cretica]|uniref:Uncharacterized protein n=1 Tax=Brassica cretica TaxID=69181 RepID=A0A8S9LUW7_BRACR|nr:hypothetical protein F2Q70_00013150 [Brassica cretica]